jgi:hypothetical protein
MDNMYRKCGRRSQHLYLVLVVGHRALELNIYLSLITYVKTQRNNADTKESTTASVLSEDSK